jgi:hypothetical protein
VSPQVKELVREKERMVATEPAVPWLVRETVEEGWALEGAMWDEEWVFA